jgi:hypothetical protein
VQKNVITASAGDSGIYLFSLASLAAPLITGN